MGTELAVYDRMANPLDAVKLLGAAIAKSRMFGCDSTEQGEVLALACMARRCDPLALVERYHLIDGSLTMRADAMLAEFHRLGGKHRVVERTENAAEIELTFDGQTLVERLTWEAAKGEPFPFGKGGVLKKNWATPRARRQMLWARVVSESVRTLTPEICQGTYTPEEMGDLAEEPRPIKVSVTATVKQNEQSNGAAHRDEAAVVVDTAMPASESHEASTDEPCTEVQAGQIRAMIEQIEDYDPSIKAKIRGKLDKLGAAKVGNLTFAQAASLLNALFRIAHEHDAAEMLGKK